MSTKRMNNAQNVYNLLKKNRNNRRKKNFVYFDT